MSSLIPLARRARGLALLLFGTAVVAAPLSTASTGAVAKENSAASLDRRSGRQAPADPRLLSTAAILSDPGQFATDLFVLLNWPADPNARGVPAGNGRLGQASPTVWESFKNSSELYLPQGATPCAWETRCELPGGVTPPTVQQLQQAYGTTDSTWLHFLAENRMIDNQQIVDAKSAVIRYDVRCNQEHFNFVAHNPSGYALFTFEGQELALKDPQFTFNFPHLAIEVKAAWRILGPADNASRYWTAYGAYYDANQKLTYAKIGLTAFHLTSNIVPNWIWLTYEQVDNPKATFEYFLGQKGKAIGRNLTANPQAKTYNKKLLSLTKGSKWQYYQIIGWQTAETNTDGTPVILANSNLETYFAQTSSCMSCHAMANIGPPSHPRLDMWNSAGGGIVGRIGQINFQAIAKKEAPNDTFKQMIFVWSLREAQSTTPPAKKSAVSQ